MKIALYDAKFDTQGRGSDQLDPKKQLQRRGRWLSALWSLDLSQTSYLEIGLLTKARRRAAADKSGNR